MNKHIRLWAAIPIALCISGLTSADPLQILTTECASCHALESPDYEALGRSERVSRKAPPLFFAGNKYRAEWLLSFLQSPSALYAAGYFPDHKLLDTPDGDFPNEDELISHISLAEADAKEVSDYLMTLRPFDELVENDSYTEGTVAKRMGTMDFRKFKGCDACHQDDADNGGLSGPRLYDAWARLQPKYIASFLKDPMQWDPNTLMPVPQMNEQAVHKLVDYLKVLGEAE
tara:strand:+ start:394 stop:1086 length:693 start_codon:yes stop_codon:yes gene_type:complete